MMQTETKRNTKTKGKRKSGDQLKIIATLVYRTQYKCICKHFFFFDIVNIFNIPITRVDAKKRSQCLVV